MSLQGRTFVPGQGNNAYVFPGVGLGAVACGAQRVTDRMFLVAARALAGQVQGSDLEIGRVYPSLERIRDISAAIAAAVIDVAFQEGLARAERPSDLLAFARSAMWEPHYEEYCE